MMRAAQFEAGGPEKLTIGEVPIPQLRQHEVLIRVYATAINRADTLQVKHLHMFGHACYPLKYSSSTRIQ